MPLAMAPSSSDSDSDMDSPTPSEIEAEACKIRQELNARHPPFVLLPGIAEYLLSLYKP